MQKDNNHPIINFSDILFVYKFKEGEIKHHTIPEHTLLYVYSGELTVKFQNRKFLVKKDECIFLARNHNVWISARAADGVEFKSTFLTLTRNFLITYFRQIDCSVLPSEKAKRMPEVMKLPNNLHINSLFRGLATFFIAWEKPTSQYMELKQLEGVKTLIDMDARFCINLFDFVSPWKIDILSFMNKNFMEDLTLKEMALYTGRSLSSFKRDFKEISDLSPQRWVTRRRLQEARRLMEENHKKVSDIYLQLGFKSFSHFSTAFKREFGISPTKCTSENL